MAFRKGDIVVAQRDVRDHRTATLLSPAKTVVLEGMVGVVIRTPGFFDFVGHYEVRFDGGRIVRLAEKDLAREKVPALH